MSLDKQIVIRASASDRAQWEKWATERGMTVAELVRTSVTAYVKGEVGISFAPACMYRERHRPGYTCPACGGSTRQAA